MQIHPKRLLALVLVLALVVALLPPALAADRRSTVLPVSNCTVSAKPDAPTAITTTAGATETLALQEVFTDSESHNMTYTFESDLTNPHIKIADGSFWFTAAEAGTYKVTLNAICAQGATASHTVSYTVEPASQGIEDQYDYDETPAKEVTVYVTISNDGIPIQAADGTILSHLEVTVPYFDLGLYGLESYYRYGTDGGQGGYVNNTVIERPTGLHLYLYLLERYYMGLEEAECCKGTSGVLSFAEDTQVYDLEGEPAYSSRGKSALSISGSATSLYMVNFWGHDENLMYYRNHCYPYMSPGWGATSDYILLSDGDAWDVALFSNWSFHHSGYFACFERDAYSVNAGASLTVKTQAWGTTSAATSFTAKTGLNVGLYDKNWKLVQTIDYNTKDGNALTFTAPKTAGTYYLLAVDPNARTENATIAPATARVTVTGTTPCPVCTDADGDKLCDVCGKSVNLVPVLAEGTENLTVKIQTGHAYQLDNLMNGKIFTDPDGDTLTYESYFYRKSSDGGKTWGELTGFIQMEHGGINSSLSNSAEGTYLYEFWAWDGYGYSEETWLLTLEVMDVVPAEVSFYVGRDQNYAANSTYPVLELYRTAGLDENSFDYVGWFTDGEGKTQYVYNPQDYEIVDRDEADYVVIDGVQYSLHGYEKIVFTNSTFDPADGTATASGTVVDNYKMYYAAIESGRYSTRAYGYNTETGKYDVYLGGQSLELPMEKDIYGGGGGDIYLRVVSCYTTSKKTDSTYFTAEDYHVEMIMPVTGSMIHAGSPYVSGNYTYYPFMSYAAGNASLYNVYAYPHDTENYIFNQSINNTTGAGYTVVNKSISINTAVKLTVTVPRDALFDLYFQFNNFNTKAVTPEGDWVTNEDGTKTVTYKVSKNNANYTWRLTDPSGTYVTKAGWLANLTTDMEKAWSFGEGDATNKKSHDFSGLGTAVRTRDEADIQVFLDHDGFMRTGDTYRVRAYRMWQLINSDTANIMAEPEFHIQVLQGNPADVSPVNGGNAVNNWIDVKPSTTDIIAVNYDAISLYSTADNAGSHGGLFPATAPERTGVFVITNKPAGTADAVVSFNGGKDTDRGAQWDYNYDTWYYLNTDTAPTLDFTVTSTGEVTVACAMVITNTNLNSTLSGWTALTADTGGNYQADLLSFRTAGTLGGTVIIRMTDSSGTSYRLVRVAEMTVTLVNATNPDEPFMPGDDVTVTFDGLYRAVNKVAGIFNPTTYYLRYTVGGTEVNGKLGQYQQMDRASITLTIPQELEIPEGQDSMDYTFTNGYIYGSMYSASSPFDTLYNMTDTGVGTNFSAVGVSFVLSRLADIPVTVERKVTYDVKIAVTDGENPVSGYTFTLTDPDGNALTPDETGIYPNLGYGTYGYTLAKAGYICQNGKLKLGSADKENVLSGILTKTLVLIPASEGAWDGVTTTEPTKDESGVYQISTGAELAWLAQTVSGGTTDVQAVLTGDIDLACYSWIPMGNSSNKFAGSLDGQGHKIINMSIINTAAVSGSGYGLLGYMNGGRVKNLTVEGSIRLSNSSSVSNAYAGGMVGACSGSVTITNVHANVDITITRTKGNWSRVGGIVGSGGSSLTVINCSSTGTISGYQYVGGIVGYASGGTVTGCCNAGNLSGYQYIGGIIGSNAGGDTVSCYNTGAVTASSTYAGGIAGQSGSGKLTNCFNTGIVSASNYAGGVAGNISKATATISSVYYLDTACDQGFGKVTGEYTATTITAETLSSADFVTTINTGLEEAAFMAGEGHPILTWQGSAAPAIVFGDLSGDGEVSSSDAALLYRYAGGKAELTEAQLAAADVNGDGEVNSVDAALIYRYVNGKIAQFPTGN